LISLVFLPLFVACASTARITGDFGDYGMYRQVRLATTLETRLENSLRYLLEYPHGDYSEQVRSWFSVAERRYFRLAWDNLPRLRAYLSAMPHGPHAAAVGERISELELRSVFANRREQRIVDRARTFEQRLTRAAEQRRDFLREFGELTRLLAATRSFGQPISELDSELLLRFRVPESPGRCENDHCTKIFSFAYSVPEDKELSDRKVDVLLEVALDRGLVQTLALSGPELLSRVAEAAAVRAVPPGNPQARAEALGQALDVVADALDASLPKSRCEAESVSPIVLARRCDGLQLDIVAGTDVGALDRIVVRAESR
jgi:hypothetical protein